MLDFLKRGQAARDVRLMAARGVVQGSPGELLAVLVWLTRDTDAEVRTTAAETLRQLPVDAVRTLLDASAVSDEVRAYFDTPQVDAPPSEALPLVPPVEAASAPTPDAPAAPEGDLSADDDPDLVSEDSTADRDSILQKLTKMSFSERLKAASKGTRAVRSILIRDPSKMIAMAVLTSPKLTEPEVEAFARMGNVSEDVLRFIGSNRTWMKNYPVVLALVKNAKTPLGLSLNLMNRLNGRDLQGLSTDRNVPEPLRVAARKKVVSSVSR
jgi:hypothetical protein